MIEQVSPNPAPEQRDAEAAPRPALEFALRRARWAILWERLWPALARLATALGLFLAASWLGLWLYLPSLGRAAGLIAFAVLAAWAAMPLVKLRMPVIGDGLRRLDRSSGRRHRPATAIADELAVTSQDPYSLALWHAHVERALRAARSLKAGAPSPRVAWRDPYALRALVLIACVATFLAAGGERWRRVAAAFDWHGVVLPANFRVDAWVIPPAYTGKPPVVLPGIHPGETAATALEGPVAVPVNSTLVVRSTGKVNLELSAAGGVTPAKDDVHPPAGTQEHRFNIAATGSATLRGAGDDLTWPFNAIPDKPPTIELTKDPERQNRGSLLLSYRLEDDYGVIEAKATFARKDEASAQDANRDTKQDPKQDTNQDAKAGDKPAVKAHPLYGPPDFTLTLPQARSRNAIGQTIKDLTDHPWAGADVTMTLTARDEGGNEGKSEPFSFRLPERIFTKPLARALVEQRRNLALDANSRPLVITALDALAIAPEKFMPQAGTYLGLRSIFWSLVRAKSDDDMRDVAARLWQMAVGLEDGDISDAQDALRNAENALQQALERGASDDEIKQLMDQLRAAMDRFMQAMAGQLKNRQQLSRPLSPNTRMLSQQDLQNMLNRLENLARNGAKDAARQLLQELQQMMENLQMASPDMDGDESDAMMSELDELGNVIHQQQDLRDKTFRQGQDQRAQNGQRGQNRQGQQQGNSMGELRQSQQALRDRLNKLLDDLRDRGLGQKQQGEGQGQNRARIRTARISSNSSAAPARRWAMPPAASVRAIPTARSNSQGRALDALRKGAQGLAQSMQQQMGQGQGQGRTGRFGQSRAQQETDPLGRPLRGHELSDDTSVKVPGEIDVQRARRIIDELRKRFGDFARPQEELDYIERLLKDN